jgi:hypothetical protein
VHGAEFLVFAVLCLAPRARLSGLPPGGSSQFFFSITYLVSRDNPALLDERRKPLIQEGQPKSSL